MIDPNLQRLVFESDEAYSRSYDEQRLEWIADALDRHIRDCVEYRRLCASVGFSPEEFRRSGDYGLIPLLTTNTFKGREVTSDLQGELVRCYSSGTSGTVSTIVRDNPTLEAFVGSLHSGMREFWPIDDSRRAFVLAPQVVEPTDTWISYVFGFVETFYPTEFFVDPLFRPWRLWRALERVGQSEGIVILAPPSLLLQFLRWLKSENLELSLPADRTLVVTGGGWKDASGDNIGRDQLVAEIGQRLGLPADALRDTFNMVELNTALFQCEHGAIHVPPWLSVRALNPGTLAEQPDGADGVLAFVDPTATSYPAAYLSDDIGSVVSSSCFCGRHGRTLSYRRRLASVEERGCSRQLGRLAQEDSIVPA